MYLKLERFSVPSLSCWGSSICKIQKHLPFCQGDVRPQGWEAGKLLQYIGLQKVAAEGFTQGLFPLLACQQRT
jgi:hypothetical protein